MSRKDSPSRTSSTRPMWVMIPVNKPSCPMPLAGRVQHRQPVVPERHLGHPPPARRLGQPLHPEVSDTGQSFRPEEQRRLEQVEPVDQPLPQEGSAPGNPSRPEAPRPRKQEGPAAQPLPREGGREPGAPPRQPPRDPAPLQRRQGRRGTVARQPQDLPPALGEARRPPLVRL